MSVIAQNVSLEQVVAKSSVIFVASSLKPLEGYSGWQVEVHELLKGEIPVSGSRVKLRAANSDLHAAIGESLRKNEPAPMPILDSYRGRLDPAEFAKGTRAIVFAKSMNGELELAVEGAFESLEKKADVLKLIRSSKK